MCRPKLTVVIPTLNAEREIDRLLRSLESQSWVPEEIIVIDSSSDDSTVEIASRHSLVRVLSVDRSSFDHGATRNEAFLQAKGDFILYTTQDAAPLNEEYIQKLMEPFADSKVALTYGRQVAKPDAKKYIQMVQEYNYPLTPSVKTKGDVERLGIKAYFCSDVCSAYRRSSLEEIGGIPHPCSTNEDMLAAARLLRRGYTVAYVPSAAVLHSHNFGPIKQFRRNRAVGSFLREHHAELDISSEVGEGRKMAETVLRKLVAEGRFMETIAFMVDCVSRLLGNRIGRFGW